ncbi:hypothetical protein ACWIGI_31095 [Nocardia sp. NPDC055321]
MINRAAKTFAAVGLAAFLAPALLAPPASAKVFSISASGGREYAACTVEAGGCGISVILSGADRAEPVTVKINDTVLAVCTPFLDEDYGYCNLGWNPPANGKYTISASQGGQTKTAVLNVPGNVGTGVMPGSADPVSWLGGVLTGSVG